MFHDGVFYLYQTRKKLTADLSNVRSDTPTMNTGNTTPKVTSLRLNSQTATVTIARAAKMIEFEAKRKAYIEKKYPFVCDYNSISSCVFDLF